MFRASAMKMKIHHPVQVFLGGTKHAAMAQMPIVL